MKLKRVWDTTEKKIARVPWANGKPCQVWYGLETEKFYKQDINGLVEITDEDINVYWPNWDIMNTDDVLGYYDTNEPTELFSPEDWDEATYTFKDYDGTVLDTGKVKDWETPVAPEDPTREGYEFTGWKPKVKPIYKDTTYTAQYTINKYTITATSSDADLWTVSPASVANVEYGTALTVADNVITVGTGTSAPTITATAGEGWEFVSWWTVPATVTGNTSVEAEFQAASTDVTVTFVSDPADAGYVMGYERDDQLEEDVETAITSAVFTYWTNLSVVVWQDTSIQFDDLIEDRHTEYFPVPNGSNTFVWVFIGETEVTDQAIELTQDTTLTVKFQEDSR